MRLITLATGSKGNCYLLENDTECLILEAGIPFIEVKKYLDFNVKKIVGLLVTHQHMDHARYIHQYEREGIKILAPWRDHKGMVRFLGGFQIFSFPLMKNDEEFAHTNADGSDCPVYGFLIHHHEIVNMIYATDCSLIRKNFRNLKVHHFLVECNYSDDLINIDKENKGHVLEGHMELQTCKRFIRFNDHPMIETVTLCHLSKDNADANIFKAAIQDVTTAIVNVAKPGLEIDLETLPFR